MNDFHPLSIEHAAECAAIHAASFDRPWSLKQMQEGLQSAGAYGFMLGGGFILCRAAAGEAELLTLAVLPEKRRAGLARQLLRKALAEAGKQGAKRMFLEVAQDNQPAIALYKTLEFTEISRRPAYYDGLTDALVMAKEIA